VRHGPEQPVCRPANANHHQQVLSDEEAAAIWRAAGEAPHLFGAIVRLLMLTGQRREEVAGITWAELFGKLCDLDHTCRADQERDSASRASKPASARASPRPRAREARGWRDFDADYSETLSKPDGGPRFGPADIGALGDPCHREGTPPGRVGFVSNDGKYGHGIRVQMFSHRGWYDHSGSKISTAPHTSDAVRLVPIVRHRGSRFSIAFYDSTGADRGQNKGRCFPTAAPLSLHARRSANEQPTGEAERLTGPRAGPVGLPR
jgi:hypothetical protein